MGKVNALYVDPKGPYPVLVGPGACWDIARDARKYHESFPVVAHPPCQLWTNMAAVNYKRWGGAHNRPGNDGGTFKAALSSVRRCRGVLEHPAFTKAWAAYGLTPPSGIGWTQTAPREWVCEIWQSAYGHRCRKRTWLFYCGDHAPYEGKWGRPNGTHQIGYHDQRGKDRNKPTVPKREASESPREFAEWLIGLAHRAAYGR
jgi:hypothetical protein